ncbi:unnamed protein product [Cuscuta campestris]|uniref:Uncharacterized protein n=1 Tax=Cuscuta campestris TaxID=132261 RepID=A0A484KXQ1_9ASTE|nr:unnamed protein product [Cuscuta campestris]
MAAQSSDPMDRLPTGLKLFVRNLQSLTPVKLDDTNYPSWSATVRANLIAHRLLGYVDGSEVPPPPLVLDEKAAAPGKDEPPVMKPNPAYDSWVLVDAQIRACLLAIVSPTVQTHIHALPSSAAIWNHLEQRYNSLSRTHIFQLKERLHSIQKGTDSMQTYLDTVLTIVSSLKLAHEDISEQDIILCVLRGLPTDYASLKQNVRTNIATVTFNQLLINKKAQKVVFAEAEKPFVDFLFYIMSLPVGTVIKLVTQKAMVGSLGNLYGSIADLGDTYLQPGTNKDTFLNPKMPVLSSDDVPPLLMPPAGGGRGPCSERKKVYVMSLKLLINKKNQKVVFAEAEKPFVDFLFYIMSLPVGTVIKLISRKAMVGSLGNLYGSIADLGDTYLQPGITKDAFLNPKMSAPSSVHVPLLMPAPPAAAKPLDSKKAQPSSAGGGEGGGGGGGFVRGVVGYMVMDDLKVMPQSTISAITTMNDSNINDFGSLEVKVVSLDVDVANPPSLLKNSITSSKGLHPTNISIKSAQVPINP